MGGLQKKDKRDWKPDLFCSSSADSLETGAEVADPRTVESIRNRESEVGLRTAKQITAMDHLKFDQATYKDYQQPDMQDQTKQDQGFNGKGVLTHRHRCHQASKNG